MYSYDDKNTALNIQSILEYLHFLTNFINIIIRTRQKDIEISEEKIKFFRYIRIIKFYKYIRIVKFHRYIRIVIVEFEYILFMCHIFSKISSRKSYIAVFLKYSLI